jgi:hypothetical protein
VDVWTYFAQREQEAQELSLAPETDYSAMVGALAGSDDKRGRIFGHFILTEDAYLQVSELVVVEDDHVHREEYGYFLIIGGEEVFGFERDPTHDPPEHGHGLGHAQRREAGRTTFKAVVELAWEEVTRRSQEPEPGR